MVCTQLESIVLLLVIQLKQNKNISQHLLHTLSTSSMTTQTDRQQQQKLEIQNNAGNCVNIMHTFSTDVS